MQTCAGLGGFDAGDGRYVLDVDVAHDGSPFNSRSPRLAVQESGGVREAAVEQGVVAFWGLSVLLTLGTAMMISSALLRRNEKLDLFSGAWHLTQPGRELPPLTGSRERSDAIARLRASPRTLCSDDPVTFPRRRETPSIPPAFTRPAWFGLLTLLCYLVIDIPIWAVFWSPPVARGLAVRLAAIAGPSTSFSTVLASKAPARPGVLQSRSWL